MAVAERYEVDEVLAQRGLQRIDGDDRGVRVRRQAVDSAVPDEDPDSVILPESPDLFGDEVVRR